MSVVDKTHIFQKRHVAFDKKRLWQAWNVANIIWGPQNEPFQKRRGSPKKNLLQAWNVANMAWGYQSMKNVINTNNYWIINNYYGLIYPIGITNTNYIDALLVP